MRANSSRRATPGRRTPILGVEARSYCGLESPPHVPLAACCQLVVPEHTRAATPPLSTAVGHPLPGKIPSTTGALRRKLRPVQATPTRPPLSWGVGGAYSSPRLDGCRGDMGADEARQSHSGAATSADPTEDLPPSNHLSITRPRSTREASYTRPKRASA